MRIVEEGYLKRTVAKLNIYAAGEDTYGSFYEHVSAVPTEPLQDLSFQTDLAYFDEMGFVLSVIASIIGHPHVATRSEEIILRTEFANTVSADTFRQTLRDARLWKQDELRMVPEYVHYHQSVDELCIYENIFVVMLVKLLAAEIGKYEEFYASLIQTFRGQGQLSLDEHNVSVAMARLQKLGKKLRYVQNTRFYKEINRKYKTPHSVHPTNVLLKDRLYNYCFKFYRSLVTYPDKESQMHDFGVHYYTLLLKSLRRQGFCLCGDHGKLQLDEEGSLLLRDLTLTNDDYRITLVPYEGYRGIVLTVEHRFVTDAVRHARHLLLFSPQSSFADVEDMNVDRAAYTTVEAVSLWNMAYAEEGTTPVYRNPLSEEEVMDEWLSCKLASSRASVELYRSFCPSCQSAGVLTDEHNVRSCGRCGSRFVFFADREGRESLWFLRLRRLAYGKK